MKHGIACYCQHSFAYIFIPPSFSLMYRGSPHLYSQHLVRFPLVRNFLSHHQKVRPKINHELLLQTLFCIFFCPPLLYIYRWKLCCKPILELPVEFITKYFFEVIEPWTRSKVCSVKNHTKCSSVLWLSYWFFEDFLFHIANLSCQKL